MSKLLTLSLSAAAALAGGVAALPAPAQAQQGNIAEIIVYGNDPCPRSTESSRRALSRSVNGRSMPRSEARSRTSRTSLSIKFVVNVAE